jgi:transcriptional regulator with XRE-family HTH domain
MGRGRPSGITQNERRLRDTLAEALGQRIGTERGAQAEAARVAGVTRQAMNGYLNGRATPSSETLRKLCASLNVTLNIEGAVIGPDAPDRDQSSHVEPEQLSLFEAISGIDERQLGIRILKRGPRSVELKVSIDFGEPPVEQLQSAG